MRKFLFLSFLFVALSNVTNAKRGPFEPPIDTVLTILKNFPYERFVGKPVDSLILNLPTGYTISKVKGFWNFRRGNCISIEYANEVYLNIIVKEFKFMNPKLDRTKPYGSTWDANLFRKEKVAFSILYQGGGCLKGCENDPYH